MSSDTVVPVALDLELPAGVVGTTPVAADVCCFLVPHGTGVLVVDAGPPGSAPALARGLEAIGATWNDVTDVVLTHSHFDHTVGCPTRSRPRQQLRCGPGLTMYPTSRLEPITR